MIDLAGHVFYVFLLGGMLLLARGSAAGWILRIVGEAGWAVLGVLLGMSSIVVWGVAFVIIDAYGFRKWRKNHEHG